MQVDFYVLNCEEAVAVRQFACRLAEKAYLHGHSVHVQLGNEQELALMDEQLWTFRDGSFVPHDRIDGAQPATAPVTLGSGQVIESSAEVVMLVDCDLPQAPKGAARIAEIVSAEDGARQRSRERFRHYKSEGIEPTIHKIGAT